MRAYEINQTNPGEWCVSNGIRTHYAQTAADAVALMNALNGA